MEDTAGSGTTSASPTVCDDRYRAAQLVAAGHDVVLVLSPDDAAAPPPLPPLGAECGRLALLVGRPNEPQVQDAARAMAAELFGPRAASGPST